MIFQSKQLDNIIVDTESDELQEQLNSLAEKLEGKSFDLYTKVNNFIKSNIDNKERICYVNAYLDVTSSTVKDVKYVLHYYKDDVVEEVPQEEEEEAVFITIGG